MSSFSSFNLRSDIALPSMISISLTDYSKLDIQIPTPQIGEVGDDSDDGKDHEATSPQQHAEQSAAQ